MYVYKAPIKHKQMGQRKSSRAEEGERGLGRAVGWQGLSQIQCMYDFSKWTQLLHVTIMN